MDKEFSLYIRRCHICDTLNENASPEETVNSHIPIEPVHSQQPIKCSQCGKFLAPFIFSDPAEIKKQLDKHADQSPGRFLAQNAIYPPLIGLAIYW